MLLRIGMKKMKKHREEKKRNEALGNGNLPPTPYPHGHGTPANSANHPQGPTHHAPVPYEQRHAPAPNGQYPAPAPNGQQSNPNWVPAYPPSNPNSGGRQEYSNAKQAPVHPPYNPGPQQSNRDAAMAFPLPSYTTGAEPRAHNPAGQNQR